MVKSINNLINSSQQSVDGGRNAYGSNAPEPTVSGLLRSNKMSDYDYINGGAFLIARQIFESEFWLKKPSTWKVIWVYILGKVNHKKNKICDRGEGFFYWTKEYKEVGVDITLDMIKKSTCFFKKNEMISTSRSTRGVRIKVIQYNKYQIFNNYSSTSRSTNQALEKHQRSTPINNNDNNVKNDKEIAKTSFALKVKNKKMRTYNENESYQEPELDLETGEVIKKLPTKKYPNASKVFSFFGKHPANWKINKTQLQAAENLYTERGSEQILKALNFYKENKEDKFCPVINSPYDLDSKWNKLISFKKRK